MRTSSATVTVGTDAQIHGSGTVGIFVTAQAGAVGQASSQLFSLGAAVANATAIIDIRSGAFIRGEDSVNIVASAEATAKMKTSTERELGDVPQDPTGIAISFAVAIADLTSTATLADTAVIEGGRTVNFRALGKKSTEADAESGMYADGTASVSGAVAVSEATVNVTVGGRITAEMAPQTSGIVGTVKLEFDPTALAGQLGYIDAANNTIYVGPTAVVAGDSVTYSNRGGTSIGGLAQPSGLANGKTYYIINVEDDPTTPFDESQTVQLATNELNSYRGKAINLMCDGFDPLDPLGSEICVVPGARPRHSTRSRSPAPPSTPPRTRSPSPTRSSPAPPGRRRTGRCSDTPSASARPSSTGPTGRRRSPASSTAACTTSSSTPASSTSRATCASRPAR